MSPQFTNMNDLVAYLDTLESRIKSLESSNATLQADNQSLNRYIKELGGDAQKMLPKTGLLSTSFMQRAFTVWGHYFVAQLLISIPIVCIYLVLVFFILSQGGSAPSF